MLEILFLSGLQAPKNKSRPRPMRNPILEKEVLNCTDDKFNELALKIFHFQAHNCAIYRQWLHYNDIQPENVTSFGAIPYLPVSLFKQHEIRSIPAQSSEICFRSSSTTGQTPSQHFVPFPDWYETVFTSIFEQAVTANPTESFIALLPGYMDRPDSSLIYMVHHLMESKYESSHFFRDIELFLDHIQTRNESPILLIGVSYALLELATHTHVHLPKGSRVLETGGMKGKGKEWVREELHKILISKLGIESIGSEYGMTELMSQAYAQSQGLYQGPSWMQVRIMDSSDPFHFLDHNRTGRVCIADLANLYSCAFIATDDLGKTHPNGQFEIAGRFDFSDVRGCNLMWS